MGEGFGSLSEAWERNAADWAKWTRAPGHDVYHERLNWSAFRDLLPVAGRRAVGRGAFDLAVAYMSLQDVDDLAGAVGRLPAWPRLAGGSAWRSSTR